MLKKNIRRKLIASVGLAGALAIAPVVWYFQSDKTPNRSSHTNIVGTYIQSGASETRNRPDTSFEYGWDLFYR
jgi:hypothetical protein